MNKNMLVAGGVALVIAVVVFSAGSFSKKDTAQANSTAPVQEQSVTNTNEKTQPASWAVEYSPEAIAQATADDKKAVLFFHATWCPTCQAAITDFETNQAQIPDGVTIIKANFDTETELKKKYGVVMQDTFIQVDKDGNTVTTWNSGGEGIKTLLANLK